MENMTITSAQYVAHPIDGENASIRAVINNIEVYVPLDAPGNRHYAEILRQVEAGTLTIEPADTPE